MAFGHYLRREREGRDMTLTELARRVEVSIAYLSRIERERENPPPDRLVSALGRRPWPACGRCVRRGAEVAAGPACPHRRCHRSLPAASRREGSMTLRISLSS